MNIITIEPARTYATRENAEKAVQKWYEGLNTTDRVCNVLILEYPTVMGTAQCRYYPLMCNIDPEWMQVMLHRCPFNIVN